MSHGSSLVIASEDGNSVRETHFERDEKCDSLNRVVTTVNIVTHEEIVGFGALTSDLEQFNQIMELTVNVSANCDWGVNFAYVRLVNQDFFSLNTWYQHRYFELPYRKES